MKHGFGVWKQNHKNPKTKYYEGEYRYDRRCGRGKLCFSNGDYYEGDFEDDEFHGFGRMNWVNKKIIYEGWWERGRFKGYGKLIFPNGEVREGYFVGSQLFKNE